MEPIIPHESTLTDVVMFISVVVTNRQNDLLLHIGPNNTLHLPTCTRMGDITKPWAGILMSERKRIARLLNMEMGVTLQDISEWTDSHDPTVRQ